MPFSPTRCVRAKLGTDSIDHVVPSHRSTKGRSFRGPSNVPTAMHSVAVGHATPYRAAYDAPTGLGEERTAHLVPFHASIRVLALPSASAYTPTAMQDVVDGQSTAKSRLAVAPKG